MSSSDNGRGPDNTVGDVLEDAGDVIDVDCDEDDAAVAAALTALKRRYSIVMTVKAFESAGIDAAWEVRRLKKIAESGKSPPQTQMRALAALIAIREELLMDPKRPLGRVPAVESGGEPDKTAPAMEKRVREKLGPQFFNEAEAMK